MLVSITYTACSQNCTASNHVILHHLGLSVQDPSYDPYGYAKVVTRAASSIGGSTAACPGNVQKFFKTLFDLAKTQDGFQQINTAMSLCDGATVDSYDAVNQSLAQTLSSQWTQAVSIPPLSMFVS